MSTPAERHASGGNRRVPLRIGPAAVAAACALALLAAGCGSGNPAGPGPDTPPAKIAPNVVIVDSRPGLSLYDKTDDTLILDFSGTHGIEPADILVGAAMGGYLRKAWEITAEGGRLHIGTRPARLVEAVRSGWFEREVFGGNVIEAFRMADGTAGGLDLSGVDLYSAPGEGDTSRVTVESGRIGFDPSINLGMVIAAGRVRDLELRATGPLDLDLSLVVDLAGPVEYSGDAVIAAFRLRSTPSMGGVPVPVDATVRVGARTSIGASGPASCTIEARAARRMEMTAAWTGSWETLGPGDRCEDASGEVTCADPADLDLEISIYTEIEVRFYSSDPLVLRAESWLDLRTREFGPAVWEWALAGGERFEAAHEPGLLDFLIVPLETTIATDTLFVDTGPFSTEDYSFVAEWTTGPGGAPLFENPRGIAVSDDGRVYVTDDALHRVSVFDRSGTLLRTWGSFGSGEGDLLFPSGVDVGANGLVHVADQGNHRVARFTPEGAWAGAWDGTGGTPGPFPQPDGLGAGPDSLIVVTDSAEGLLGAYTTKGDTVFHVPSLRSTGTAVSAGGDIYTAVCGGRILAYSAAGALVGELVGGENAPDLGCPVDVASGPGGKIFVLDNDSSRILVLSESGELLSSLGSPGTGSPGQFMRPFSLAVSSDGWVFVADTGNDRVQVFAPKRP